MNLQCPLCSVLGHEVSVCHLLCDVFSHEHEHWLMIRFFSWADEIVAETNALIVH